MARILCVDDEPHVVTLKCAILERAGHVVTASTSAQDAIQKLQSGAFDAVVTDWRLGDANGRTVVEAAKLHSSTPVVVVSGYVAEAFQAAEPLADLYLEKPVNPEELVTIVNELLNISAYREFALSPASVQLIPSSNLSRETRNSASLLVFFVESIVNKGFRAF